MARWFVQPNNSTYPDASGIVFTSLNTNIIRDARGAFFASQVGSARAIEPDFLTLPVVGVDFPFTLTMPTPDNVLRYRKAMSIAVQDNQTSGVDLTLLTSTPDDTPRFIASSGIPEENSLSS